MHEDSVQTNKLEILGKLTASLVHEIRNSLSVIKFNLEYMEMLKEELPDSVNDSVIDSSTAISRIQYLVDNILSFTKKNSDNYEHTSINRVAEDAINVINIIAKKKNIQLNAELDFSIPRLFIDPNKVFQVFINLLTNAVESCQNGDEVKIVSSIERLQDDTVFVWEVKDSGSGISREIQEKIFSDFYTSKENGTGLGLGVCLNIIKEMHGELSLESMPGLGTSFFLKFRKSKVRKPYET